MTSRALPLLLAALVLAGGLGYLLLGDGSRPSRGNGPLVSNQDPRPVRKSEDPTPQRAVLREELIGSSGPWTVLPVGSKGQLLPEARVTARRDREVLTGTGRAIFTGLTAGEWSLTVEAEGLPTYTEVVTLLGANQPTRTTAQLTNEIRLSGYVIDQRGDPAKGVHLWLLHDGEAPPKDGTEAKSILQATSTADGRFRLQVVDPGRYRIAVGRPGAPSFESTPFELELGRERLVRVVVPAKARLRVEAPGDDFVGKNVLTILAQRDLQPAGDVVTKASDGSDGSETRSTGRQVSKEDLEAVRKKQQALGDEGGDAGKPVDLTALTAEQQVRVREAEERAERERQRRGRLIEEGWASVRSLRFDSGTTGIVDDLPEEKQLRFVLYRGIEGLLVGDSLVAPSGATVALTLTPPPPLPTGTELPDYPRTSGSRLEITRLDKDALPVGLTFEN